MKPTYEEQVANINSVASTSAEDKARAISYLDKPISLDTLKANEQPVVTKPQTIETEPTIELSELDTETERIKTEAQKQEKGITDIYKLIAGEEAKETEYIEEMGGFQDEAMYKEKKNALMTEQKALRDRIEKARITFGGTTAGLNDEIRRLERESSNYQADLALEGNLAMGRYESALNVARKKVESAIKPLQADLESRMFIYNNNKDLFSKAEGATLERLFAEEKRKIEKEEKTLQTIEDIKIEAAKNGMKSFTGFDKVKTVDEALNLAGSYLNTPQNEIVKLDNGSTVVVDKRTGKIINTLGGVKSTGGISGKLTPEFESIASRTASLVDSVTGQETIKNDLTRYLKAQDYVSAYNQIENTVANGLTGTTKTTFSDARIDSEILKNLKGKIQEFENAGGDTGLLKGTAERIIRKLGQVKDPALASLAVELQREFQRYRVGMTGAAFSPAESRDYASVNPKTTNKFDLNVAVIDGAISQLDNRVNSTVDSTIKGAGDIRRLAEIPKNNARELSSNPFLQVSQSLGQIYNPSKGWIIPGQSN